MPDLRPRVRGTTYVQPGAGFRSFGATQTWPMSSTFNGYGMYFKAGDYDQTSGSSSSVGARVAFYAVNISHSG